MGDQIGPVANTLEAMVRVIPISDDSAHLVLGMQNIAGAFRRGTIDTELVEGLEATAKNYFGPTWRDLTQVATFTASRGKSVLMQKILLESFIDVSRKNIDQRPGPG